MGLAISPDGKTLALGLPDQSLRLWDVATGKELNNLSNRGFFQGLAFSPDGKTLSTGGEDHRVRLWDVATGKEVRPFGGHTREVLAVALSPDGRALATGGVDDTVRLWDAASGRELSRLDRQEYVAALAFAPDGKALALGSADPERWLCLVDAGNGKELRRFAGHEGRVTSVTFTPDGKTLLSGSLDRTIRLWDVGTGKELRRWEGARNGVLSVALSDDGRLLVSLGMSDSGPQPRLWDLATGKERSEAMPLFPQGLEAVALSPDGRTLAAAWPDDTIHVYDLESGTEFSRFPRDPHMRSAPPENQRFGVIIGSDMRRRGNVLCFSPDGRTLLAPERDNRVLAYETLTGKVRRDFQGHQATVRSLAMSGDGRVFASGGMDGTALVWDLTGLAASWRRQSGVLGAKYLDSLWDQLSRDDDDGGFLTLWSSRRSPQQVVSYLKERLRPVARPDKEAVQKLIAELDDETFAVRERASRELERLERVAEPPLARALELGPSAEARRRIEALLERLDEKVMSRDRLRAVRVLELLEYFATPEARALVTELAGGAPEAWLTREAKACLRRLERQARNDP